MIYEELKMTYDRISGAWPEDARAFSATLLTVKNQLENQVKVLEGQLTKNSRNSSKPPSQDVNRLVNQRDGSGHPKRGDGGQQGYKRHGCKLKDNTDYIVSYTLRDCPAGGCKQAHEFEYGFRVKALAVYLSAYQFIPQKRVKELLEVFDVRLSTGTLNNFRRATAKELGSFIEGLRKNLSQAPAAYFDETGIRVGGVNHWVHVACSKVFSLFGIYRNPEKKAHEELGVLAGFIGIAHRDAYRPYNDYAKKLDSLCSAHIVRELEFAIERDGHKAWAWPLKELLLQANEQVARSKPGIIDHRWQGRHRKKYRALVKQGLAMNPESRRPETQTMGVTKQTKIHNLLMRLHEREDDVLRFMVEPLVEFTNNQAERDLLMNKVRTKVSGGVRMLEPAQEFMRICSLIGIAIKQAVCPLQTLEMIFTKGNSDYMKLINPD